MPEADTPLTIQHLPHSAPHPAVVRVAVPGRVFYFDIRKRYEDGTVALQPTDHPRGTTPPAVRDALAERGYYVGSRVGSAFTGPPPWRVPDGSPE